MSGAGTLGAIFADIKLAHSVFALPFAFIGLLLGTRGAWPTTLLLGQFLAAMVCARCAAMAFNRLVDRRLDATNPRTAARALPAGRVSAPAMAGFTLLCALAFVAVAGSISPICLALSPLVLAVLFGYSLAKRWTSAAHLLLGAALALAPPAAWLAARGRIEADVLPVLWLSLAVALWVAGFDIIYACQDVEHDRRSGLHSVPAALGPERSLLVARLLHVGMLAALVPAAVLARFGALGWTAVVVVAATLVIEHRLAAAGRVGPAFFTANGLLSLAFGVLVSADLLWP